MLGKFTCLFDYAHRLPVLGSSREPVRFHVWVSLGVAALAATGVERLGRPGVVSLRSGLILAGVLVALSIPIMIYIYIAGLDRARALDRAVPPRPIPLAGRELSTATLRTGLLALAGLVDRARGRAHGRPGRPGAAGRDLAASGPGRPLERALGRRSHGRPALLDRAAGIGAPVEIEPEHHPRLRHRRQALGRAGVRLGTSRLHGSARPAGLEPAAGLASECRRGATRR